MRRALLQKKSHNLIAIILVQKSLICVGLFCKRSLTKEPDLCRALFQKKTHNLIAIILVQKSPICVGLLCQIGLLCKKSHTIEGATLPLPAHGVEPVKQLAVVASLPLSTFHTHTHTYSLSLSRSLALSLTHAHTCHRRRT